MARSRIAVVVLTAVVLSGCAQWSARHSAAAKRKPDALFIVNAETTPFYRHRPQHGHGPDRQLPKDTLLTVIRHAFGYSKVQLADGQKGFVANDDLVRASGTLIAAANDSSSQPEESIAPTPEVKLPVADPELEPTPLPDPLMPQ
jgi:hypothetical protein